MNEKWNKALFFIAFAFVTEMAALGRFSAGLNSDIQSGNVYLDDHTLMVRKNISGANGIYDIIDETTKKITGISTLNENKLSSGQGFIFDRISVTYAKGAAAAGEKNQSYGTGAVPQELRNSFLVISQKGREIINEPIANFIKGEASTSAADNFVELLGYKVLQDEEAITMRLVTPNGVSIDAVDAANNHFLEIRLKGAKTTRKAA